jgi:hypothetical protein
MSDTTTTDSEPQTEPVHDPGPDFKAKVREVLEEILPDFLTKEPEPEPTTPSKPRSLRQEESDMEHLVEKVLGKLKSAEPPAPPVKPEPVVEVPPGPPPRKRRVQTLMWGD